MSDSEQLELSCWEPGLALPYPALSVKPDSFAFERIILCRGSMATKERADFVSRICALYAEDFDGWEQGGKWDDLSFMDENGQYMGKMAIVGEKKWEDLTLLSAGKGLRPIVLSSTSRLKKPPKLMRG